ncbi:MAG TPA: low molecular weight protein arginine phosphatase [Longimicrobium sp.]|nr:low molecular weight protein arginine phosphatase [Longimicrobium sp.]
MARKDQRKAARARRADEPEAAVQGPRTTTFNILFVCTGNTCRSPLAEGIARAEIRRRGWKNVEVGSAGLAATDGSPASAEAVTVAGRAGIDLERHRSRPLTPRLVDWADLILGMGASHVTALDRMGAGERATTLGDFAAGAEQEGRSVADPYGQGEAVYEETFQELRGLIGAALDRLAPILAP